MNILEYYSLLSFCSWSEWLIDQCLFYYYVPKPKNETKKTIPFTLASKELNS